MSINRIIYKKPNANPGMFASYELNKHAPDSDFPLPEGIVVRYSPKKATVCTWETIACLIVEAMAVSPEFRAHIKAEVERAEAIAADAKVPA